MTTNLVFVVVEPTLDDYFEQFIQIKKATRRPRTVKWYTDTYRYYKAASAGLEPDWPPTPAHGLAFFEMLNEHELSDHSRSNYYRGIRGFFNWLVEVRLLAYSPLVGLGGVKAPRPLPKAPDEEDVAELLKTVSQAIREDKGGRSWQTVRDLAMFSLALDTGARLNELVAMRRSDLSVKRQEVKVFSWKDKEGRVLTLGDEAAAEVAPWLDQLDQLNPPKSLTALWVSNYQGKGLRPLTDSGIAQRLRYWLKKAEVSHFSMNNLRHAYAVFSLRNGANLIDIKDQMGHANIKTTAIYLEVVNKGRAERHRKTSSRKYLPFDS
jgi:integrase/recombinase XerC